MSNLIKCDRCGAILPAGEYYIHFTKRWSCDISDRIFDLCPDCSEKLDKFLSKEK